MNIKKVMVLLFILIVYVNYNMHFKKDIFKIEKNILNIKSRILQEKKLLKEKKHYEEINSTIDYSYLFYNGANLSYSSTMGEFQQLVQVIAKETKCKLLNTQWQDMPINKEKDYDVLSLKLSFGCTPKAFIKFQNKLRTKSRLFNFTELRITKSRRKNFLNIITTLHAYRSKKNEK